MRLTVRIFFFTLLTFIATQSSASDLFKMGDVFFCNGKHRPVFSFYDGFEVARTGFSKTVKFKIENKDKLIIKYDDRKLDFDIKVIEYLGDEELGFITSILAERTRYNISNAPYNKGKPASRYWRVVFDGNSYSEITHNTASIVIYYAECEKF